MTNKALFDAKKIIAQIVTDVVNLEDINFTVPEVQTLLDGITVGGHKLQDELIALNQIKAWKFLFSSLEQNSFAVTEDFLLQLHDLVANQEALAWGKFRTGQVTISGTDYLPPKANELVQLWQQLENETKQSLRGIQDKPIHEKVMQIYRIAISLFAQMAHTQFFFDGNKRTARMMMSGLLLTHGLPMINVSAKKRLEFNQTMIAYYDNAKLQPVIDFMLSCIPEYVKEEYSLCF
jgi:Fic family protein